jgi:hypothetical protein
MAAADRRSSTETYPLTLARQKAHADGAVAVGVLIVLMTSALVVAIWGVARDRLIAIVSAALSSVCGSLGC